jgi:iron(II)-dependent oxidoreductase
MMGASEQQAQIDQDQCNTEITNCGGVSILDETPQHEVCFEEPFWIDRHEVSNADFGRVSYAEADLPRTLVNWPDAQAHCELRGGRLPTEAEWEYAARGPDSWRYPWGGELQEGAAANFCDANCLFDWKNSLVDDGYAAAAPVGAFPTDASWVGALDMSGNATEWTHSAYMPLPYYEDDVREAGGLDAARTVKGGSFRTVLNRLRSSFRFGLQPLELNQALGFRCMLPYEQNE